MNWFEIAPNKWVNLDRAEELLGPDPSIADPSKSPWIIRGSGGRNLAGGLVDKDRVGKLIVRLKKSGRTLRSVRARRDRGQENPPVPQIPGGSIIQ